MKVLLALLLLLGTAAAQQGGWPEAALNSDNQLDAMTMAQRLITGSFGKPVAGVDSACNMSMEMQPLIEWYSANGVEVYTSTDVTTLQWEQMCGIHSKGHDGKITLDTYAYDRKTQKTKEIFFRIDTINKTLASRDGIWGQWSAPAAYASVPPFFQRAINNMVAIADKQETLWNDKIVAAQARANQSRPAAAPATPAVLKDNPYPTLIFSVDPEFSDEARKKRYQGTVLVGLTVNAHGYPEEVHVLRGLGMGLDEKAIEAVKQYRFAPVVTNGKPVSFPMKLEVDFHVY